MVACATLFFFDATKKQYYCRLNCMSVHVFTHCKKGKDAHVHKNTLGLWVEAECVQLEMRHRRSVDTMWAVTDDQTLAEYQLTMGLNKLHEDLGA